METLVIVESPSKAKTIKKYLGKGYEVIASMGHVRDLPKSRLSVDVKNNYTPKYTVISKKKELVKALKEAAKKADEVFLATDPDREGEAISWHLSNILKLDENKKDRVTFNEITKRGIEEGMANPRKLDMDLINAQQARRVLDRLVGYTLSPFLSKRIRRGLSAGRVQSVSVRMIVDREEEIRGFTPEEYWSIDGKVSAPPSRAKFNISFFGDEAGEIKITSEQQAEQLLDEIQQEAFLVTEVKKGKRVRNPSPPFITSTLQQEASKKLGFAAKRTMKAAQELYEGVELKGEGAVGLITYMRTDSLRISEDAVNEAKAYIQGRWGSKYLQKDPIRYKSRANAQDGHEAIRPATVHIVPEEIKASLTMDQYRLYKLIWERFLASQMERCRLATTKASIRAGKYLFRASGSRVTFEGFTALYQEVKEGDEKAAKDLPVLEAGMKLKCYEVKGDQHFTQPPPRYTEASLIKALEENGIGRPSTYATTISTITSREYVIKEGKAFRPTELGEVITMLMKDKFSKYVNLKFTAAVEDELDSVQRGESPWVEIMDSYYKDLMKSVDKAAKEMGDQKIKLKEDETDEVCDLCGKPMEYKYGRYGRFLACSGYPDCKNVKKTLKETGAECPKCGGKIIERKTRRGRLFYGCSAYPNCHFACWDPPSGELCPKCGKALMQKQTKNRMIYCKTEGCGYERIPESTGEEEEAAAETAEARKVIVRRIDPKQRTAPAGKSKPGETAGETAVQGAP